MAQAVLCGEVMNEMTEPITDLEELLDRINEAAEGRDAVALGEILESIGTRSFGPLLLLPGLVTVVPGLGDIPGVTASMAVFVLLIAGQLLFRRKHLWLPKWLLNRSVTHDKLVKGIAWMRRPARFVDRWLQPRLKMFSNETAVAATCIVVGCVMPLTELVPFGAIAAGVALLAFGLALVADDGLLALIAFGATAITIGTGVYYMI